MDDITNQRLAALDEQLKAMRKDLGGEVDELHTKVDANHEQVVNRFREVELRLTTEVREVGAAIRDLKAWLVERDDTRQRLAKLEQEFEQLRALVGGGKS